MLCFHIGRNRAAAYAAAGISHHEIHYWERHRRRLGLAERAEQDETLAVMAALNTAP